MNKHLDRAWDRYYGRFVPPGSSYEQVMEIRRAFLTGMSELWRLMVIEMDQQEMTEVFDDLRNYSLEDVVVPPVPDPLVGQVLSEHEGHAIIQAMFAAAGAPGLDGWSFRVIFEWARRVKSDYALFTGIVNGTMMVSMNGGKEIMIRARRDVK